MSLRSPLQHRGVISHTPSRLPGILSFLLTGALFTAVLFLTLSQARAEGPYHCDGPAWQVSACQDI